VVEQLLIFIEATYNQ